MRKLSVVLPLLFLCHGAFAVTAAEAQADGMNAGAATSNTAASGLNAAGAQATVPGYSASDQSSMSSNFGGNSLNVLGVGRNAQCDQAGFVNNGSMANQECNASVTLRRNTNISTLTPDQIPQPSSSVSVNSILGATTTSKVCRSPGQAGNAVTDMQTCNEALVAYESVCNRVMNPACGFTGSPIKDGVNPSGQFGPVGYSVSGTSTPGLYNYSIWGGGNRTQAGLTLSFFLDTIGRGSYITINLSNLDDAMAIGANSTTVFAGRPNSECNGGGPVNFFAFADSGEYGSYQPGYSECWTAYRDECTGTDWDGNCTGYASVPYQQCVSGVKVANHCVRGTGGSLTCTPSGKMVYIPTEGCGTYSGAIPSATIPLVAGQNNIQVWWGNWNAPWGDPSGQFNITGQIYNVGLVCTAPWTDNCLSQKALP